VAPKIPFAGSVAIASLAANSITSQTILFSNPLNPLISLPAVSALVNTTGSTNGSYVLPSFSNLSIVGFSLDTRNLHTSAAATAFNATWSATQL
jgi:hypothetical protein